MIFFAKSKIFFVVLAAAVFGACKNAAGSEGERLCRINFDANGGEGTMLVQAVVKNVETALWRSEFWREGGRFVGWAMSPDGEKVYSDREKITISADVTLFAIWEFLPLMVSFDANGGNFSMPSMYFERGETKELPPSAFAMQGKSFAGWALSADGEAVFANCEKTSFFANATLFAVWKDFDEEEAVVVKGGKVHGGNDLRHWHSTQAITVGGQQCVCETFVEGAFVEGRVVEIDDFEIGKYPVTKNFYKKVMQGNPLGVSDDPSFSSRDSGRHLLAAGEEDGLRPVENVSVFDAMCFCNRLSEMQGLSPVYDISDALVAERDAGGSQVMSIKSASVSCDLSRNGWRLPTEAEWEFAARGGSEETATWLFEFAGVKSLLKTSGIDLPTFDIALNSFGWYAFNNDVGAWNSATGLPCVATHQVGLKAGNRLNLCDMSGNVYEFCHDFYAPISRGEEKNPAGPSSGWQHVIRGGCWARFSFECSVANRWEWADGSANDWLGFRIARRP